MGVKAYVLVSCILFLIVSISSCFAVEMSLTYDANGNLVTGDGKYRIYNSLNQLWKIYNGSNTSLLLEEYIYHPIEERVVLKKNYNSSGSVIETTYYINQNYVQVINLSGTYNYTYYFVQGQTVAQDLNGVKTYYHTDIKGNVVTITNNTGQVTENNLYSPTGEILTGGNKSRHTYEGKEYDKTTGQTDFNFRMLSPGTNQFIQPDTIIQKVYDPQSLNRYAFERNNPMKNTDPSGHKSFEAQPGDYIDTISRYEVMFFFFPKTREEVKYKELYSEWYEENSYTPRYRFDIPSEPYAYSYPHGTPYRKLSLEYLEDWKNTKNNPTYVDYNQIYQNVAKNIEIKVDSTSSSSNHKRTTSRYIYKSSSGNAIDIAFKYDANGDISSGSIGSISMSEGFAKKLSEALKEYG